MGLDDLDGVTRGSSRSSSSRGGASSDDEDEERIDIGSEPNKKSFSKEKWESVKQVIRDETEYTVKEVKNLPEQERYNVLHDAATWAEMDNPEKESDYASSRRCAYCNKSCDNGYAEIGGKAFHPHHTAGQVASMMEEEDSFDLRPSGD